MGCAFAGCWETGCDSGRKRSAFDCRIVREWRLVSSSLPDRRARKPLTLSWTKVLFPKHTFPVASSLAQPQMASSVLKSGLYPGRVISHRFSPGLLRNLLLSSPYGPTRCPRSDSACPGTSPQLPQEGCRRFVAASSFLLSLAKHPSHSTSPVSKHTAG